MTEQQKISAHVGDVIHLRAPMTIAFTEHESQALPRGAEFEVTEELYAMSVNRKGESWLDLTPEEQVQRWGMQKFGIGPCPPDITWWNAVANDGAWNVARDEAMLYVSKISDPAERAKATEEVRQKFGRKNNVTTLSSWGTQR
ncbi:hypothetical protein [Microbacterium sp. LWS13-1.2]|uniref:Uncharacterized protein n=1 Tax=Microbacterium sp. LWS13-1.2 TaxID=3135264 RepID=A0AAU6S7P6_9MICO